MIKLKNFVGENSNISVLDQQGSYMIIQHESDLSVFPTDAQVKYFMSQMGAMEKQLVITLKGNSVKMAAGVMQMMLGNIQMKSGVKGVGDLFGKALKSKATGDSAIKPEYSGNGYILTEPTYRHILIEDTADWGGSIVCDDGMFLACDASIKDAVQMRSNLSSAVAGGEGLFNLMLNGAGHAVFQSKHPREELVEIIMDNDTVKIDGNMAVCWTGSLQFTVERAGTSLIGSAASGEGLVNVYRGSGRILMCPV